MRIGVPRETKPQEGRVALLPRQIKALTERGHQVVVQQHAGAASGARAEDYVAAGARIVNDNQSVFSEAQLIVKVKEILPDEYDLLRPEHIIFTNIHGAADPPQIDRFLEVGLTAIAAEETHEFGSPNSVLAGEIGALEGVRLVLATHGGTGRHFMGHFDTSPARALVLGLGQVGRGTLRTLLGLGLSVVGLDVNAGARREALLCWHDRDLEVDDIDALPDYLGAVDLVINCVLWDKTSCGHLITREMLQTLRRGAVIVDISCDPGGAIETSRVTTWDDPVYEIEGVRHFCVDNIPGAAPVTASAGYAQAILPHIELIAEHGPLEACRLDLWLARGLTCADGVLTSAEVARVQNRSYTPAAELLPQE